MANFRHLLSLLLISGMCPNVQCQMFSSFTEIRKLVKVERNLIDRFLDYFRRQSKNGVFIEESAKEFVDYANQKNAETNETFSRNHDNPLCTYHVLKRAIDGWTSFKQNLSCTGQDCPILTGEDIFKAAMKRHNIIWPEKENLHHAALSILNIWAVYDLDISQLAQGMAEDVENDPLTADDIFYIASSAKDAGMDYEALSWFQYLVDNALFLPDNKSFSSAVLFRRLASAYHQYGMTWKSVELLEEFSKTGVENKGVTRDLQYFRSTMGSSEERKELKRFQDDDNSRKVRNVKLYESVCKNGNKVSSRLLCYILPLHQIYGVVKMEEVSGFPRIIIYYDVISDKAMKKLVDTSSARVLSDPGSMESAMSVKSTRMCESRKDIHGMQQLTKGIGEVMGFGLSEFVSTCYMLSTHSTGGKYTMTTDYLGKPSRKLRWFYQNEDIFEQMVATIMFQLSDVSYGGETAFPQIQASIPVAKGSMAVWYNLWSSGHQDTRTAHIDCPVVVGPKWTGTNSILYNWRIAARTCDPVTGRG